MLFAGIWQRCFLVSGNMPNEPIQKLPTWESKYKSATAYEIVVVFHYLQTDNESGLDTLIFQTLLKWEQTATEIVPNAEIITRTPLVLVEHKHIGEQLETAISLEKTWCMHIFRGSESNSYLAEKKTWFREKLRIRAGTAQVENKFCSVKKH